MNLVRIGRSFSRSSASTFQKNVVSGNYGLRNEFTNALSPRFDAGLGLARGYLTSIAAASRNKIVSEIDSVFKNNLFPRLFGSGAPKKEYANYYPKNKKQVPKGNNQKAEYKAYDDDDSDDQDGGAFDIRATVNTAALTQMDAALDALARELTKLRTGRASVGVLDHIIVVTNGMKIPLNGMAAVSVLDPKTLSVSPYDPTTIKELEKAIVASPLGLNPKVEGQRLIAAIPPLTKEHMQAVCKLVTKSSEDAKQSIRRARQKALDTIKKSAPKKKGKEKTGSSISADDAKKLEKEVEDMTKKYIKSAEDMSKAKEKEITET